MEANNYSEYLEKQMIDAGFRAYYVLFKEKARLEILVEKLKEQVINDAVKKLL